MDAHVVVNVVVDNKARHRTADGDDAMTTNVTGMMVGTS